MQTGQHTQKKNRRSREKKENKTHTIASSGKQKKTRHGEELRC